MPKKPLRVLITGSSGFVGTNLVRHLKLMHPEWHIGKFNRRMFDITDREQTQMLFKACAPDYVIHLAAHCGGIGANMASPASMWASNLQMGINVLDSCVQYGVSQLVALGSVCSFPRDAEPPFKAEQLCTGWPEITNRPYGIAKLALYEGCRAFGLEYGLKYTYLVPTNMYGPHDNFDLITSHVIPAMLRKFHDAKKIDAKAVALWGDGSPTRDFLYVVDCARAIEAAMGRDAGTDPILLGNGTEVSMKALAEMIATVTGFEGDIIWDTSKPNGQPRRAVDNTMVWEKLHWKPSTALLQGVKDTYEYYLGTISGDKA